MASTKRARALNLLEAVLEIGGAAAIVYGLGLVLGAPAWWIGGGVAALGLSFLMVRGGIR